MNNSYVFIDPQNEQEQQLTDEVSALVKAHWEDLWSSTSLRMQSELDQVIVRTLWDSSTRDKYGEYYGVPAPKQTPPNDTGMLSPEIAIFAWPLLRDFPDKQVLHKKVRTVLVHEIGHHLGLSEGELRRRKIY